MLMAFLRSLELCGSTAGFSGVLDKLDIPDECRAMYKAGLEKARDCIRPLANDAPAERITQYVEKLTPVVSECSKSIAGIEKEKVKERQDAFGACLKDKVQGGDEFDDKQKEVLPKIKQCVITAIQG